MDRLGAMSARGASGWKQTPVTKQHDGNNAVALEKKPPHPGRIEPGPNSGRTLKTERLTTPLRCLPLLHVTYCIVLSCIRG